MPILIDFSGTIHAAVHVDVRANKSTTKEFLRHIILNQIRAIRKRFHEAYGEAVICMDSRTGYWRRDVFPYYKAKRKEAREASDIDWGEVFEYVNGISQEIKENLPYKCIQVNKAEADDIIGTLAIKQPWGAETDLFGDTQAESCLIVSNDHDFKQLHRINNVTQYFPFSGRTEKVTQPDLYLVEHILKGDTGDGIPNVRSPEDIFMSKGVRQKPISTKYIKEFLSSGTVPEEDKARYEENKQLIDLRLTPEVIQEDIIEAYKANPQGSRFKLFSYLAKSNCQALLSSIEDF